MFDATLVVSKVGSSFAKMVCEHRSRLNFTYNTVCGIQIVGNNVAPHPSRRGEEVVVIGSENCARCGKADCHLGNVRGIGISLAPKQCRKAVALGQAVCSAGKGGMYI